MRAESASVRSSGQSLHLRRSDGSPHFTSSGSDRSLRPPMKSAIRKPNHKPVEKPRPRMTGELAEARAVQRQGQLDAQVENREFLLVGSGLRGLIARAILSPSLAACPIGAY